MQRSEIRDNFRQVNCRRSRVPGGAHFHAFATEGGGAAIRTERSAKDPGLRCAASGLRLLDPNAPRQKQVPYGRTLAEIDRNSSDIDPELKEQIKDLRDDGKTTTEIAGVLGLEYDLVARVPARPMRNTKKRTESDDEREDDDLPEELAPEEEEEDDIHDYDHFMRNRKVVAGGEI